MRSFFTWLGLVLLVGYTRIYKALSLVLLFAAPYIAMYCDRGAYRFRGYFGIGGEFLVPVFVFVASFLIFHAGRTLTVKLPFLIYRTLKDEMRRDGHDN